jgi:predicted RNase H-like HicB family nuclease
MKVYHVIVEQSEGWLAAHALEDDSVHTQGKTLNEITANIRDVAHLVCGDKDIHVELVIPSNVKVA